MTASSQPSLSPENPNEPLTALYSRSCTALWFTKGGLTCQDNIERVNLRGGTYDGQSSPNNPHRSGPPPVCRCASRSRNPCVGRMAAMTRKLGRQRYTGAQRLVMLYERLLTGKPIRPTEYAREVGLSRSTVYYQLNMLSACGIPVVNVAYGRWTLLPFAERLGRELAA